MTNESAGALFGLSAASGLHREGEPGLGDEELRLLVPAWPSGGREKFPGKANPGSGSNIDRGNAGLESDEATAMKAVASISSYLVTLSTLLVPIT
jgi:hypothetical protein